MHLDNPRYYHERIFYNALRTDTSLWTMCADKYEVRRYVTDKCGSDILPVLYGVWEKAEDIDFDKLPMRFVLKTNNGCGTNIIVRDKNQLNKESAVKKLRQWLKLHFGAFTAEPHYYHIPPKVIAEEFLEDKRHPNEPLRDYKFMCFNGVPTFVQVMTNRKEGSHDVNRTFLDMQWNDMGKDLFAKAQRELYSKVKIDCPESFEKMKEIASKLSAGIPYVRVDLYDVDGQPKFGEMTFTPGMDLLFTDEMLLKFGSMIPLADGTHPIQ